MSRATGIVAARRPAARWVAGLSALSLGVGALGIGATPAAADTDDLIIPVARTQQARKVIAESGGTMVVADPGGGFTVIGDTPWDGQSADVPGFTIESARHVADGSMVYASSADDGQSTITEYDFADNLSTSSSQVDGKVVALDPATGLVRQDDATGAHFDVVHFADPGTTTPLALARHKLSGDVAVVAQLGGSDRALITTTSSSPSTHKVGTGYLDLLPTDGSKGLSAKVSGLAAASQRGDQVVYLTTTTKSASVCFRTRSAWTKPVCRTLRKGNVAVAQAGLWTGAGWTAVAVSDESTGLQAYVVGGSATPATPTPVDAPDGATLVDFYGASGAARPFAHLSSTDGGTVSHYLADGSYVKVADYVEADGHVDDLELTPTTVFASDDRPTNDLRTRLAWSRSITGAVAGPEHAFAARASLDGLSASGARSILRGTAGVQLLDRGDLVRTLPTTSDVRTLSGAYYLAKATKGYDMRRVDGTLVKKGVSAIFGSSALLSLSKRRFQVVDVTKKAPTVTGVLPAQVTSGLANAQLWGDWVVVPTDGELAVAFDYRNPTGSAISIAGTPQAVGDGFAVLTTPDGPVVWTFSDGATSAIPGSESSFYEVATDGTHRIAFSTDEAIVVRPVTGAGVGQTQPLVLGAIAPTTLNIKPTTASWKLQVDTTKPLTNVALTISNAAGPVRTITGESGADGSVRLAWNGRDSSDATVPTGAYTWALAANAADGTGPLAAQTGTITVTNVSLGTVALSPKLSAAPVVDQAVTVSPGTVTPASATLSYQWKLDGVDIADATDATYQVLPEDAGHKLTVTATGEEDGWKTTTKTTVAVTVAKATLFAPKPVIDPAPEPAVGKQLRASPEEWNPAPVDVHLMQWYRVKGSTRKLIAGETNAFYNVTSADVGWQLQFAVTGSKPGYTTKTMYSKLTIVVPKPAP